MLTVSLRASVCSLGRNLASRLDTLGIPTLWGS